MYIQAVLEGYRLTEVPPDFSLREKLDKIDDARLEEMLASIKTLHNHTDTDTRKRLIRAIEIETYYVEHPQNSMDYPELDPLVIGITVDREVRRSRITERLYQRLASGMVEEVRGLLESGLSPRDLEYYGLEYRYLTRYITGRLTYDEMVSGLNTDIHQFAKRQMTWFRRMERQGHVIHWIDGQLPMEEKIKSIKKLL